MRSTRNIDKMLALLLLLLVSLALLVSPEVSKAKSSDVYVIDFNDIVHGVSADYVISGIEEAEAAGAALVIIKMQTPGGMINSMEQMIKKILASKVPVVGYVGPSGAKAASAGFYLLMACDVAVMAPGTRTGAATPIMMGGGGEGDDENYKTLMEKVKGDSRAFLRSLIRGRQRHPEIPLSTSVEKALTAIDASDAFTEQESLEFGLIDFIATDIEEILAKLDGTEIRRFGLEDAEPQVAKMNLDGVNTIDVEMDFREQFLSYLSNPMIALLLGTAGILGLYIEINNPGLIFPGSIGAICLVMAAISFQVLTVNWAGALLMFIGLIFFVLEFKISSYGMLTVGGIICLILGGLMMFEGPIPELRLNLWQLVPFAISFAAIALFLLRLVLRAHSGKVATGKLGLIGANGKIIENGKAFVHGEIWNIENAADFEVDDDFVVENVIGLNLLLKKVAK
jgi:membrane-bound serine protease (ClpP class)